MLTALPTPLQPRRVLPPRPPRRTPLDTWAARLLGTPGAELDRAALERHQLALLQATVARARARSPLYRERLDCLPPGAPSSLAALQALPFTTAADLRERGAGLLCVSQDEVARVVTLQSSGTSGLPKRLFFTAAEQEATVAFFEHGMSTLVGAGDRVLILLPGATPGSAGELLAAALRRLGAVPIPHGFVRDLPEAAQALRREEPTALVGAPVHALALARFAEAAGSRARLRAALLTTDHLPRSLAAELARILGCEVFEHYGMTEMALGGAVDCEAHQGCHLREPELLVEIVDPATGAPLPPGAPGEIVFTTLTRRALPLLRYRTGDLSRLLPGRCACGSILARLERVRGRRCSARLAGGVGLAELDEALFAVPGVLDFSAVAAPAGGGRSRLSITLRTLGAPGEPGAERALEALQQLPALREASRAGALVVEVAVERSAVLLSTGAAKRVLACVPGSGDA